MGKKRKTSKKAKPKDLGEWTLQGLGVVRVSSNGWATTAGGQKVKIQPIQLHCILVALGEK